MPYYIAWGVAGLMMIERPTSRPAVTTCAVLFAVFEIWARINYGTETYEFVFDLFMKPFPALWTMGECLKMTRASFPIILVVLMFVLDNTLDKQKPLEGVLGNLSDLVDKQKEILENAKTFFNNTKKVARTVEKD